ncbi:MAG: hydroxymethylglutaryl-CoA synthase [Oceanospirillaceae bacterium]|jgi:hydroxymethylglutaryl-CoA synthase|nr:hydroxymethylglutaryl-CoA synthase [Oceanospirillaceae bacterium]MBT4443025.1 hydroxymethylglutaryl-CoA synthase [Oceanospirillaceae bacterium]MBT6077625.1 hydroxymethylglutaryl-CoA synthase [Oceanospirillaceae bacterium]
MPVGIDDISFYTANFSLDLQELAANNGSDAAKYTVGIGQERMSVPGADEDVVTMAANACVPLLEGMAQRGEGTNAINTILFATETGIDQSKAAGVYLHSLLKLNPRCRVVELKQACYSATAALQLATAWVARKPQEKVLVVASDIARYDRQTPGEATQGCGAVAMIVSANPRLVALDPETGIHTEDVMDFWRPNYRSTALVDGKYSTKVYLRCVRSAWQDFQQQSQLQFGNFDYFCYHLPFSRMAQKAHNHLANGNAHELSAQALEDQISSSLIYNRITGNSYTAAMYIGLISLLDNTALDLAGKRVGFFSYGSGSVGEFFTGTLVDGYQSMLHSEGHQSMLASRKPLNYAEYQTMYGFEVPVDGGDHAFAEQTNGKFRLAGISQHKRLYEAR